WRAPRASSTCRRRSGRAGGGSSVWGSEPRFVKERGGGRNDARPLRPSDLRNREGSRRYVGVELPVNLFQFGDNARLACRIPGRLAAGSRALLDVRKLAEQ